MPQRLIDLCNIALFSSVDNLGKLRTDGYLKALENNDSINENLIFKN
jgi:hypothetical protein